MLVHMAIKDYCGRKKEEKDYHGWRRSQSAVQTRMENEVDLYKIREQKPYVLAIHFVLDSLLITRRIE